MSHNHNHATFTCHHESVKYCSTCYVVYCENCGTEWVTKYNWTWTTTPLWNTGGVTQPSTTGYVNVLAQDGQSTTGHNHGN